MQEENLLWRLDTVEEKGENLHQQRICQVLGAMTTTPYYLLLFICIPFSPPQLSLLALTWHISALAYAHSGWKTSDAEKRAKPTCINKDDIQCYFSFDGGCEIVSEYVDLLSKIC